MERSDNPCGDGNQASDALIWFDGNRMRRYDFAFWRALVVWEIHVERDIAVVDEGDGMGNAEIARTTTCQPDKQIEYAVQMDSSES